MFQSGTIAPLIFYSGTLSKRGWVVKSFYHSVAAGTDDFGVEARKPPNPALQKGETVITTTLSF